MAQPSSNNIRPYESLLKLLIDFTMHFSPGLDAENPHAALVHELKIWRKPYPDLNNNKRVFQRDEYEATYVIKTSSNEQVCIANTLLQTGKW